MLVGFDLANTGLGSRSIIKPKQSICVLLGQGEILQEIQVGYLFVCRV